MNRLIILGVLIVLGGLALLIAYARPPCSLEAPVLLHQLTGCRIV